MHRRDAKFQGRLGRTLAGSTPWWPPRPVPDRRPPNVVVILLDDMGFSDVGCFGSEIPTPAIDGLAAKGVRLTNFHVTPLCSPTRASLLTGLNHHEAGYGFVANGDPGVPNRRAAFPADCVTLPEVLRDNGYATYAVGKWHLAPENEMHDAASREMWPCQLGFDRFYGFLEAFTTQHHPHRLIRDNSPINTDQYPPGYYLTDDLTDEAVKMIHSTRSNDPDQPFFLYFAHAAMHGPLQAKAEDIARFADQYQEGWDAVRARRFARQLDLGLFPPGTKLPQGNGEPDYPVESWESLPDDDQTLFARMMSVYAAMVDSVDKSVARIVESIDELGELDNTVIVFLSDNGATAEGGPRGVLQYVKVPPLMIHADQSVPVPDLELLGGPRSLFHYPRGWAMACNTPFRMFKTTTHEGGVHSPFVLSFPAELGKTQAGGLRPQYQHVTDLMPTLLDLAGIALPEQVRGVSRRQLAGASFAEILRNENSETTHPEQYEEVLGNRSYYRSGWKAVTKHRRMTPFESDDWELYDLDTDPTETLNLATTHPGRLTQLRSAWEEAAQENEVYPLDEGSGLAMALHDPADERFTRPVTLYQGMPTLERQRARYLISHRSFVVSLDFHYEQGDAGILLAHGGQGGGYAVYIENSNLRLAWNEFGDLHDVNAGRLEWGRQTAVLDVNVREENRWSAALTGSGGTAKVEDMFGFLALAPFEGIDVGIDRRSPVSWPLYEKHGSFAYSGRIRSATYQPGDVAPDAPERRIEAMRAAGLRFE